MGATLHRSARASHYRSISCCRAQAPDEQAQQLWLTGSRHTGSVVAAHGPSCSTACGIFPDQGSNPCPLHWQADPQPLRHQGSPPMQFLKTVVRKGQASTVVTNIPQISMVSYNRRLLLAQSCIGLGGTQDFDDSGCFDYMAP